MKIELLRQEHFPSLFEFENRNKQWFERYVPPRPESYNHFISFQEAHAHLIDEHELGTSFFYVILSNNQVVGRVNLVDIKANEGDLGYRVCESMIGKGVASYAVAKLIEIARDELGINIVTAKAAIDNLASIRVLEKAGFKMIATEKTSLIINGKTLVFRCFERCLTRSTP